jgi:formyltetrahydrofolate deformylase
VPDFVLTLSCPDAVGIVHAVSGYVANLGGDIRDSQQFGDLSTERFFMRAHFAVDIPVEQLRAAFEPIGNRFGMDWELHDSSVLPRVLVMVSEQDHCLNDLLYRHRIGALPGELVAIVSNHRTCEPMAVGAAVAFHYLPITRESKAEQEAKLLALVDELGVDLVVLARYMQILSAEVCTVLNGRVINIHHSFLPGFKGARPYHQAYDHGVKLIGATAHYVTANLDEGPIIEQEIARVDHSVTPDKLVGIGRDLESVALARAVTWHLEHRVIRNGVKTVVFR